MIIDSKKYNGECTCGNTHKMETVFSCIEKGALFKANKYISKFGLSGKTVSVYDDNTYAATRGRHINSNYEIILNPNNLHANERGVELLLTQLPEDAQVLIAIGSGTIHDIVRYCAYKRNIDFVSCPTAASVDGFCSSVAAMTWEGCKKTLIAVAPKIVIADIDIIKNAPIRLTRSGFGDMVGKYVALTEWKIANILTEEFYCERIAHMTLEATKAVIESAENILNNDESAYEKLMYGLLLSGICMQLLGNSRCASGAEHHISHFIEMEPQYFNIHSDALHGEKVGVATLLVIEEYNRLIKLNTKNFKDYECFSSELISKIFGEKSSEGVIEENITDSAKGIKASDMVNNWTQICEEIKKFPKLDELKKLYNKLGVCKNLSDISVNSSLKNQLFEFSPMVRNRLTLMRLRKCILH